MPRSSTTFIARIVKSSLKHQSAIPNPNPTLPITFLYHIPSIAFLHRIPSSHSSVAFIHRVPPSHSLIVFPHRIPSSYSFITSHETIAFAGSPLAPPHRPGHSGITLGVMDEWNAMDILNVDCICGCNCVQCSALHHHPCVVNLFVVGHHDVRCVLLHIGVLLYRLLLLCELV